MYYEVEKDSFTGTGRIKTDLKFKTKDEAQNFLNESNKWYPNDNAKIIEIVE